MYNNNKSLIASIVILFLLCVVFAKMTQVFNLSAVILKHEAKIDSLETGIKNREDRIRALATKIDSVNIITDSLIKTAHEIIYIPFDRIGDMSISDKQKLLPEITRECDSLEGIHLYWRSRVLPPGQ